MTGLWYSSFCLEPPFPYFVPTHPCGINTSLRQKSAYFPKILGQWQFHVLVAPNQAMFGVVWHDLLGNDALFAVLAQAFIICVGGGGGGVRGGNNDEPHIQMRKGGHSRGHRSAAERKQQRIVCPRVPRARPTHQAVILKICSHRILPHGPEQETLPKASTCKTWSGTKKGHCIKK